MRRQKVGVFRSIHRVSYLAAMTGAALAVAATMAAENPFPNADV